MKFAEYKDPRKLFDALRTVDEAAMCWQKGTLGEGFGKFFKDRGFGYSARNPAASDRVKKRHYQVKYQGRTVVMEPHLKVDNATSPDQCLRIYWYLDEEEGLLVVGHVGRHLPD